MKTLTFAVEIQVPKGCVPYQSAQIQAQFFESIITAQSHLLFGGAKPEVIVTEASESLSKAQRQAIAAYAVETMIRAIVDPRRDPTLCANIIDQALEAAR